MIYKPFKDLKLSALGMGCMRLPQLDKYEHIDVSAVKEMVAYAMEKGINYFDVAWGYHGGNAEPVMGEVLSAYPRESYYLATKFPGFSIENFQKKEEIFTKQLERCRTSYFDFYLCHSVTDSNIENYLDPQLGLLDYLLEQKKAGHIRHLGFSCHCSLQNMERFLDAYSPHIEFGQIQLNWLDWELQNAKAKVQMLNDRNIPIWVMEPLRGGSLCLLAPEYEAALRQLRPEDSMPQWGFRFLESIPGVTMILSGMSDFGQLQDNIATFSQSRSLNETEIQALFSVARQITAKNTLLCTNCRYCVDYCPMELNIPALIKLYNKHIYTGSDIPAADLGEEKHPEACVTCGKCAKVCPQKIKIPQMMYELSCKLK